jgi:hypothetical protein
VSLSGTGPARLGSDSSEVTTSHRRRYILGLTAYARLALRQRTKREGRPRSAGLAVVRSGDAVSAMAATARRAKRKQAVRAGTRLDGLELHPCYAQERQALHTLMRTAGGQSAWKCTDVPVGHKVGLQDQVARLRSAGYRFAPHQLECAALGVTSRRLHANVRGPHKQPMREWVSRLPDDLVIAIHLDGFEPRPLVRRQRQCKEMSVVPVEGKRLRIEQFVYPVAGGESRSAEVDRRDRGDRRPANVSRVDGVRAEPGEGSAISTERLVVYVKQPSKSLDGLPGPSVVRILRVARAAGRHAPERSATPEAQPAAQSRRGASRGPRRPSRPDRRALRGPSPWDPELVELTAQFAEREQKGTVHVDRRYRQR